MNLNPLMELTKTEAHTAAGGFRQRCAARHFPSYFRKKARILFDDAPRLMALPISAAAISFPSHPSFSLVEKGI
jgi:hypothetical protein